MWSYTSDGSSIRIQNSLFLLQILCQSMPLKSALFPDFQSFTLSEHLLIKCNSSLAILATLLFKILFYFQVFMTKNITVFLHFSCVFR